MYYNTALQHYYAIILSWITLLVVPPFQSAQVFQAKLCQWRGRGGGGRYTHRLTLFQETLLLPAARPCRSVWSTGLNFLVPRFLSPRLLLSLAFTNAPVLSEISVYTSHLPFRMPTDASTRTGCLKEWGNLSSHTPKKSRCRQLHVCLIQQFPGVTKKPSFCPPFE